MSRLTYETALTLIYDPVAGNRAATRSALYTLGFRHIELAPSLSQLAEFIAANPPDLVICEVEGFESELCQFVQNLRQDTSGYNPFLVVIVTAWKKSSSLVSRVINSGADDLLLRPFSPALLGQRIKTHVERRKGFVITTDYVGPDRRSDSSRPSAVELFTPPNSLQIKAKEGLSDEEASRRLKSQLDAARRKLLIEKLRRDCFQICVLWRLLDQHLPGISRYEVDVSKLKHIVGVVLRRCEKTEFINARRPCEDILAAIEGFEIGADRSTALHMLGKAALDLQHMLGPDKSISDHLTEIDTTVALIHARTDAALAS